MADLTLVAPLDGWILSRADIPDPVFAEGMMGEGVAIDPVGDTLCAPCDATVLTVHAARHAVTLRAANGMELLLHLGIDSVAMGGAGFEPLVAPGDRVAAGDLLIRFDLDRLVREASAAASPVIATGEGVTIADLRAGRMVKVGEPLLRLTGGNTTVAPAIAGEEQRRDLQVALPHGLHARPAARIVAALRPLAAEAVLRAGDREASAASSVAMLGLGLGHGSAVTIAARGDDAARAIEAIAALLTRKGDDTAPAPVTRAAPSEAALPEGAIGGVPAAPGLTIGAAHWLRHRRPQPPASGDSPEVERPRLIAGIVAVRAALAAAEAQGGQQGSVFGAHREILDDPALEAAAFARIEAGANAAAAFLDAAEAQAAVLRRTGDARIAERADDLIDVGERVAHAILGTIADGVAPPAGAILLAEDLLPSHFAALDPGRLSGIGLVRGGPTSHVAILAAGAGVPMAVAFGARLASVEDGTMLILDADAGVVQPAPDAAALAATRARIERRAAAEATARAQAGTPAATHDGTPVAVQANLGSAADARAAAAAGADGCGLLRTEFLFLDRATPPDAAEQAEAYRAIAEALPDRPVTIRLLDVGGDKAAPYLDLPAEENPALGLRGIRVSLDRRDLLEAQLAAILALPMRARLRIMAPMIASAAELAEVRDVLDRLRGEGGRIALGAMVETPAAAIGADLIAREADFLSIGSNDLTQYVLAMDRGNAAMAASLDGLHPAVLRLIGETCARAGAMPVSVCGGLAADPLAAPILIGLGVRTLSVPPARIAATKALVARLSRAAAEDHARAVLSLASAAEVRALARRFAEESDA
ncbi:MAG: phosphoenolpyruvate--protein phosphotransferase [Sphingomonas sp.]